MTNCIKPILCLTLAALLSACGARTTTTDTTGNESSSSSSLTATSTTGTGSTDTTSSTDSSSQGSVTASSTGGEVTISWAPPTTRQDGTPLKPAEIRGYELYYYMKGTPEDEGSRISIDDPNATDYTTNKLDPGTYYFAMSSIDMNGIYSDLSNYVEVVVP